MTRSFVTAAHQPGDYSTNLGGEKQRLVEGNIGLTVTW